MNDFALYVALSKPSKQDLAIEAGVEYKLISDSVENINFYYWWDSLPQQRRFSFEANVKVKMAKAIMEALKL